MLTIALAQLNPTVGEFDANVAAITARMQRASADGAAGMEGILKVIQGLKQKQKVHAGDKSEDSTA